MYHLISIELEPLSVERYFAHIEHTARACTCSWPCLAVGMRSKDSLIYSACGTYLELKNKEMSLQHLNNRYTGHSL